MEEEQPVSVLSILTLASIFILQLATPFLAYFSIKDICTNHKRGRRIVLASLILLVGTLFIASTALVVILGLFSGQIHPIISLPLLSLAIGMWSVFKLNKRMKEEFQKEPVLVWITSIVLSQFMVIVPVILIMI